MDTLALLYRMSDILAPGHPAHITDDFRLRIMSHGTYISRLVDAIHLTGMGSWEGLPNGIREFYEIYIESGPRSRQLLSNPYSDGNSPSAHELLSALSSPPPGEFGGQRVAMPSVVGAVKVLIHDMNSHLPEQESAETLSKSDAYDLGQDWFECGKGARTCCACERCGDAQCTISGTFTAAETHCTFTIHWPSPPFWLVDVYKTAETFTEDRSIARLQLASVLRAAEIAYGI